MSGDRALAARLKSKLRLPVMAGPMFIASTPALVSRNAAVASSALCRR